MTQFSSCVKKQWYTVYSHDAVDVLGTVQCLPTNHAASAEFSPYTIIQFAADGADDEEEEEEIEDEVEEIEEEVEEEEEEEE